MTNIKSGKKKFVSKKKQNKKESSFQDICDGDIWAFLMERSAFSLRCFSKSSKLSSTSLSDS